MKKSKRGSNANLQEKAIRYAEMIARRIAKLNNIKGENLNDLIQDAITETLTHIGNYNPDKGAFNTFIQKAVVGHLTDRLKYYGPAVAHDSDDKPCYIDSLEGSYDADADENLGWEETVADTDAAEGNALVESIEEVVTLLGLLPDEEREIVMVRFQFGGISETVEQYVKRTGINIATFYRKFDIIRLKLKKLMCL